MLSLPGNHNIGLFVFFPQWANYRLQTNMKVEKSSIYNFKKEKKNRANGLTLERITLPVQSRVLIFSL